MARGEEQTIYELLETTIPFLDKVISKMGKKTFLKFRAILKAWKRRLKLHYTDVRNFDCKFSALFLDNVIPLIEEYHELGESNYGEMVRDKAELVTRQNATTQGIIKGKITDEIAISPVSVDYSTISSSSTLEPRTIALDIFVNNETFKPKAQHGPMFVSQVYHMLDAFKFAEKYTLKAALYHLERRAKPEKYPEYTSHLYMYAQNKELLLNPFHLPPLLTQTNKKQCPECKKFLSKDEVICNQCGLEIARKIIQEVHN